jgi:hypothetical protein
MTKGRTEEMEHERPSLERQISRVADDLADELQLSRETVEPLVSESFRTLSDSRIKSFVPILARRRARERLLQRHARDRVLRRPRGVVA